jgi:hypothetical protein
MDFNYTLKYRTFDQLLEDVSIDLNTLALENMIEPQQLIKVARRLNYDLGLRINQTKEVVLEVCHGRVKLPDDFYVWNYGMVCGEYTVMTGYGGQVSGTNIVEVPYREFPATVDQCVLPTVNCRTCNSNPCNHTAACDLNHPIVDPIPTEYDPNNPYGNTCIAPRVFMNCKGEKWELIQDNYLYTTFQTGHVYINYQGEMTDENNNLMVPNHELINDYYEYALKKRIIENLALNGEDMAQKLQLIIPEFRAARNAALSLVNTPNFREMEKVWWTNRRAQYAKYYDMFKSYSPNDPYWRRIGTSRLM